MAKIFDKEEKRMAIIDAAIPVFAAKGVANAKIADIAKAAKIGKGTVYEYFSSKEDIFAAAFQRIFGEVKQQIAAVIPQIDDPVEKMKKLIDFSIHEFLSNGVDFIGIMMDFWAEGIRNKNPKKMGIIDLNVIYKTYRNFFIQIIQDGIDQGKFRPVNTVALSSILLAAFDGILLQWIIDPEIIVLEEISEVILDALLNGIIIHN